MYLYIMNRAVAALPHVIAPLSIMEKAYYVSTKTTRTQTHLHGEKSNLEASMDADDFVALQLH